MTRTQAHDILQRCKIVLGTDFHTLSTAQVEALVEEARRVRYQRPRNANGSRARYFYSYVRRKVDCKPD
jgi:hypothetical protein